MPYSRPSPRGDFQSQVDSLNVTVTNLAETLTARLDALTASLLAPSETQLSSQPRLGPDVGEPQPGVTAGSRRMFQALGVPNRTSAGRPGSALPPPRDPEEVSTLRAARDRLLLPNLRVFRSRSHHLV